MSQPSSLVSLLMLVSFAGIIGALKQRNNYKVLYQWKTLDYNFRGGQDERQALIDNKTFIPANNVLSSARIWRNYMFFCTGRLLPGVPVSLSWVNYSTRNGKTIDGHKLEPFPNWEMQELGNCNAFQYVNSFDIDSFNRMWIIDTGRVNIISNVSIDKCPPKLVIFDLVTKQVERIHYFPPSVISPTEGFLDDIVVTCVGSVDCWAYISNSLQFTMIVYDFAHNESWAVSHASMEPVAAAGTLETNGNSYSIIKLGIDGIVTSEVRKGYDRVYYAPLASYNMYSVSVDVLKKSPPGTTTPLESSDVKDHGRGDSQTDGMGMDSRGNLYYGQLANNSLGVWDTNSGVRNSTNDVALFHNDEELEYIDFVWFDELGSVLFTSNKIARILTGQPYDPQIYNTRVMRARAIDGNRSYKDELL